MAILKAPPIMVQSTLAIAAAIIVEASLSPLGLGQRPSASWGGAVGGDVAGRGDLSVVLAFNLLGNGLRDALDPRHRG
jgi:peptide/nickel transport system permease protein